MKNTLFIGKVYQHFVEIDSTNKYAMDWAAKSRPAEGAVVRADSQSAGKGQFGSRWQAEAGKNLTLSVVLYPVWLDAADQFYLSIVSALAVRDALARLGFPEAQVKWPNDVLLHGRKTAGILIQNSLKGSQINASIVGIGLNVNQTTFAPELPNATSMALEGLDTFDLLNAEATLFSSLEQHYLQLKAGKRRELAEAYLQHLFQRNRWSEYVRPNGATFRALLTGVDLPGGRLVLHLEDGAVKRFEVKEIGFLY
jgi:BirA family biotin operon repressor/biotin-[acetyl-CoA-carboxylase] ligase